MNRFTVFLRKTGDSPNQDPAVCQLFENVWSQGTVRRSEMQIAFPFLCHDNEVQMREMQ